MFIFITHELASPPNRTQLVAPANLPPSTVSGKKQVW